MKVGKLSLGGTEIPCAVIQDPDFKTPLRLVSERGVAAALGTKRGGAHWARRKQAGETADILPVYASAPNLSEFIGEELKKSLISTIKYTAPNSRLVANGIPAEVLPQICNVWLKAREAEKLLESQRHIAKAAEVLVMGFAVVGITALVDEATGYQELRDVHDLKTDISLDTVAAWLKKHNTEVRRDFISAVLFPLKKGGYLEVVELGRAGKSTIYKLKHPEQLISGDRPQSGGAS